MLEWHMPKSLSDLTAELAKFHKDRGWNMESPNAVIVALLSELGELAEYYQWENEFPKFSEAKKRELAYEFVDVLNYLMTLAYKSDIDIAKYWEEKMPKLAEKYPVGITRDEYFKAKREYRKSGKNKVY